jgi:hypothetical protein
VTGDRRTDTAPATAMGEEHEAYPVVPVPAAVDLPDRVLGTLTGAQLGWLLVAASGVAAVALTWPDPAVVLLAVPLLVAGITGSLVRPDGRNLTRLAVTSWRLHRRTRPHRRTAIAAGTRRAIGARALPRTPRARLAACGAGAVLGCAALAGVGALTASPASRPRPPAVEPHPSVVAQPGSPPPNTEAGDGTAPSSGPAPAQPGFGPGAGGLDPAQFDALVQEFLDTLAGSATHPPAAGPGSVGSGHGDR